MHKNEEHEARTVENASVGSTPRVEGANALELPSSSSVFSYDCDGTKCQFSSACSKKKKKRRREEPFDDVTCLVVDRNRARRLTIKARTPFFETATKQRFQPLPAYSAVSFISQRDVLRISMTHKTFSKTKDRKKKLTTEWERATLLPTSGEICLRDIKF